MARCHPERALSLPPARADLLAAGLVGAMVFLASLALAGGLAVGQFAARWERGAGALMLVQVPDPAAASPAEGTRLEAVLQALRTLPGIARAAPVPAARLAELMQPWLGSAAGVLPLPGLVEVTLARPGPDPRLLAAALARAAPGAVAEDQGAHVAPLLAFAKSLTALSMGVAALVGLVAAAMVAFAVHATLAAQRATLEVLHSLGAADRWIAAAFARRAGRQALAGSIAGGLLALPVLAGLATLAEPLSSGVRGLLAAPSLWLPALLLPVPAWALARASAWITVQRWLSRLW
jgi:cell division transport system permease protein